jgi:CPA2 family monovalent cation:H+ antiporter-2
VLLLVAGLQIVKAAIVAGIARFFVGDVRKSLRAGIVVAQGGEFGFALLTLMLNDRLADASLIQPLLAATVVGMVVSPLLIRYNGRIADTILRRKKKEPSALDREVAAAS